MAGDKHGSTGIFGNGYEKWGSEIEKEQLDLGNENI